MEPAPGGPHRNAVFPGGPRQRDSKTVSKKNRPIKPKTKGLLGVGAGGGVGGWWPPPPQAPSQPAQQPAMPPPPAMARPAAPQPKTATTALHEAFWSAALPSVHWTIDVGGGARDTALRTRGKSRDRLVCTQMRMAIEEGKSPLERLLCLRLLGS